MKRRFSGAIRKTGGFARLSENNGAPIDDSAFSISVQPEHTEGGDHTEIGKGHLHRFKFFMVLNDTTLSVREGHTIEFNGDKYMVQHIETEHIGNTPVYRKGILIMEQEADA